MLDFKLHHPWCYRTNSAPGPALPGRGTETFVCQATSRSLTHPGKISKVKWSENKASFTQGERKKEARVWAAVKEVRSMSPSGFRLT